MRTYIRLVILLAVMFAVPSQMPAAALSQKTLQADIAFYRKTAVHDNLSANDRKYILNRIKAKYASVSIDKSALDEEINNVSLPLSGQPLYTAKQSKRKKERATKPLPACGAVQKILVSEKADASLITITACGVERSNYFLLKDPDPTVPPKIVLDLYGVSNSLSQAARDIRPKKGLYSRVHTGIFSKEPKIVRIVADLRSDKPYRVSDGDGRWIIETENGPAPQPVAAVVPNVAISTETQSPAAVTPTVVPAEAPAVSVPASADNKTSGAAMINLKDYKIESGDVLYISVMPADELSREVVVQADGKIPFPLIGSAEARTLTPQELEKSLSASLGRFVSNPRITVSVRQFSRRQVFITGEVHSVGSYNFKENMRLLEFISSAGGFSDIADRAHVKVYRGPATSRQTHTIDLDSLIKSGDFSKDFLLEPGDIIEVPKGQARVAVLGEVRTPGYYDYKENMKLVELISLAGGYTDNAKISNISVIGAEPAVASSTSTLALTSNSKVTKVDLSKILSGAQKDISVASGDTIYIPKKGIANASWFISNVLPWMTLLSLILVLRVSGI